MINIKVNQLLVKLGKNLAMLEYFIKQTEGHIAYHENQLRGYRTDLREHRKTKKLIEDALGKSAVNKDYTGMEKLVCLDEVYEQTYDCQPCPA